jgi:hypothetical protein
MVTASVTFIFKAEGGRGGGWIYLVMVPSMNLMLQIYSSTFFKDSPTYNSLVVGKYFFILNFYIKAQSLGG